MIGLEVPKRAIGLGFNVVTVPLRANRWVAGVAIQHATETYNRMTVTGSEHADAIMLQMPAHNAAVGANALTKVPLIDELLINQTLEVEKLQDIGAEPAIIAAAIRKQLKLRFDRRILKTTAFGLFGDALQKVVRNDIPPQVEASVYPPGVETTVFETAIVNKVEPAKLDLPQLDQKIIARRMAEHKDFM